MLPKPAERGSDNSDLVIEQRAHQQRRDHQPQRLRERDGTILFRSQMESAGQAGEDGPQHGGDHAIDENRECSGKKQH
jgi:hypothetical protein